jgi:hypothetical protein
MNSLNMSSSVSNIVDRLRAEALSRAEVFENQAAGRTASPAISLSPSSAQNFATISTTRLAMFNWSCQAVIEWLLSPLLSWLLLLGRVQLGMLVL